MPDRDWERLRELFGEAVELSPEARAGFLDERCADDGDLRRRVEELLAADDRSRDLLGEAVDAAVDAADVELATRRVGQRLGDYRVKALIAGGGMGAVYLAERDDDAYHKQVAIKIVRGGLDSPDLLARFRAERRILARLEHPHIARVIDGGSTEDGLPFLVMDYVDGLPVDRFCAERKPGLRERLELFLKICAAVDYAHRNLVVHRDLKPSNILVTGEGEPKLLDFGIAKLLEPESGDALITRTQARFLTPAFASPEQVRGETITTAADVYSLGVVLYVLLAGREPFGALPTTPLALAEAVLKRDPPPPSQAANDAAGRRALAGDLDTIVLAALRKEPERRYGSVAAMAGDVRRHLDGLPIQARPATLRYRLGKFARRRAGLVATIAGIALLLLAATAVSTALWLRADRAQSRAEQERLTAVQINAVLEEMIAAVDPRIAQGEDVSLLRRRLDETAARIGTELAGNSEVTASLHRTLGEAYFSIARYEESAASHRAALALLRDLRGPSAPETVSNLRGLAIALEKLGELDEARDLAADAVGLLRGEGPSGGEGLAGALVDLGSILKTRGDHEECEAALGEALRLRRARGGDDKALASSLLHLAGLYLTPTVWRPDDAEPLLREALDIWRASGPAHRLDVADAAKLLGMVFSSRDGQSDMAQALYQEALAIERELLPGDHPDLATTLNRLATLYEVRREFAAAELMYREAVTVSERSIGPEHPDLGTAYNNLAGVLRKTGRYGEAAELYRQAIGIYRVSRGPQDAWVGIVQGSLAVNLEWMGEFAEAERVIEECLPIRGQVWPPQHWRSAIVRSIQGACLAARGEFEEAERVLLQSTERLAEQLGDEHLSTRQGYLRLARLYGAWGRPADATAWRERLHGDEFPANAAPLPVRGG